MNWKIKIKRTGTEPASSLLGNEMNCRIHPQAQREALDGLIDEVGVVQSVIVNLRTSDEWGEQRGVQTVVDGHLRVLLALGRGDETPVPVSYVDLSPAEERRLLLLYDRVGALAVLDQEKADVLRDQTVIDYPDSTVDLDAVVKSERRKVSFEAHQAFNILVVCGTERERTVLMDKLTKDGWACKATSRG